MFNLYDHEGTEINTEDIVMYEKLETGDKRYFLIGKKMMYLYDENGLFKHDSFQNSPIDWSVTLVNDEKHRWTCMGKESEVYDEIFQIKAVMVKRKNKTYGE